ncbi:MAG: nucleotidyltransferase domain-containing protein [Legionella sp.]|nr:nucleotidyltransferase domain-containing protein [Legionella sp.]
MSNSEINHGLPIEAVNAINKVFKQDPNIEKVILYGSRAKGNYRASSDIDLCLEGQALTLKDLLAIENQLDDLLLPWEIDLSLKHQIDNPKLLGHIKSVGIVL